VVQLAYPVVGAVTGARKPLPVMGRLLLVSVWLRD